LEGEDEDALSSMGCTDVRSAKACPLRVIPECGQVAEHAVESSASERGDVLQDDKLGS
jgi:hypothetical protein